MPSAIKVYIFGVNLVNRYFQWKERTSIVEVLGNE